LSSSTLVGFKRFDGGEDTVLLVLWRRRRFHVAPLQLVCSAALVGGSLDEDATTLTSNVKEGDALLLLLFFLSHFGSGAWRHHQQSARLFLSTGS
jgi:hypothetical protein